MNDIVEMHAIVHGKVQGVGFRMTTYDFALGIGIKGIVRNLPDGSVEIKAQGSQGDLDLLLQKLQQTFKITSMKVAFSEKSSDFKAFIIS